MCGERLRRAKKMGLFFLLLKPGGGLPALLISDGKVMQDNLYKLGHDEQWLRNQLLSQGVADIEDVYVAMIDPSGALYYSMKPQN